MRVPLTRATRTAAVGAALFVALLALVAARWGPLLRLDRAVAVGLHPAALADPGPTAVVRVFSDVVWDPWTMRALTAAAAIVLWIRHERRLAVWVAGTTVVGAALQQVLKAAVDRARPHWAHPVDSARFAAFPSGHAMTAALACGLLLWVLRRRGTTGASWGAALAVAAVSVAGVGFTRLWLGVHWLSDVVAGWLLGGCLVALSVACYGRLALSRSR
ncbi:phosphatase PAP2 family protein [Streptomyces fuscigenes]|uniref:phosphatase PAP2 family protein n=1 Tax=Streptomyces fuscigenes TaxID=1528880 RepID=UPI001F3778D5|nr:phosphatase PAP2 family protein [Streptomyces fuscigenes]MCF3963576.1 phosphatase PAP2 family protein [Streptomyces fuscigenes]